VVQSYHDKLFGYIVKKNKHAIPEKCTLPGLFAVNVLLVLHASRSSDADPAEPEEPIVEYHVPSIPEDRPFRWGLRMIGMEPFCFGQHEQESNADGTTIIAEHVYRNFVRPLTTATGCRHIEVPAWGGCVYICAAAIHEYIAGRLSTAQEVSTFVNNRNSVVLALERMMAAATVRVVMRYLGVAIDRFRRNPATPHWSRLNPAYWADSSNVCELFQAKEVQAILNVGTMKTVYFTLGPETRCQLAILHVSTGAGGTSGHTSLLWEEMPYVIPAAEA